MKKLTPEQNKHIEKLLTDVDQKVDMWGIDVVRYIYKHVLYYLVTYNNEDVK